MKKTGTCSARATVAALAAVLIIACTGCFGNDLDIVKLDTEMNALVSTFSMGGDSFTLPCGVDELVDAGCTTWARHTLYGNTEFRLEEYTVDEKDRAGYFILDRTGKGRFCVCVVNTGEEEQPISSCMVYAVEILSGDGTEWSFMGLTPDSRPEDVTRTFEGILEFKALEGEGNYRLTHEDRDRLISFYWGDGIEEGITQFILETYPEGEYRNYGRPFMDYNIPAGD